MPELSKKDTLESFPGCHPRFLPIARAVHRPDFRLYFAPVFVIAGALPLKQSSAFHRASSSLPHLDFPTLSLLFLPSYSFRFLLHLSAPSTPLHLFLFRGNLRALSRYFSIILLRPGGLSFIPSAPELDALYSASRYPSQCF